MTINIFEKDRFGNYKHNDLRIAVTKGFQTDRQCIGKPANCNNESLIQKYYASMPGVYAEYTGGKSRRNRSKRKRNTKNKRRKSKRTRKSRR